MRHPAPAQERRIRRRGGRCGSDRRLDEAAVATAATRMPTPDEARLLEIGAGVPCCSGCERGTRRSGPFAALPGRPEPVELRDRRPGRPKRERTSVKITPARPDDVAKLLAFREEAAAWLTRLGSDQWQRPYPADQLLTTIQAGTALMVVDGDVTAATITLSPDVEESLRTERELSEPSSFVTKLTVARTHAGQNPGGRLLDWAGDKAYRSGCALTRGQRMRPCSGTTPAEVRARSHCPGGWCGERGPAGLQVARAAANSAGRPWLRGFHHLMVGRTLGLIRSCSRPFSTSARKAEVTPTDDRLGRGSEPQTMADRSA